MQRTSAAFISTHGLVEAVRFDAAAAGECHAEGQPQDEQNLEGQIDV